MLDMGFIHDIKKVLKVLPAQRQSLFFSATMPNNIKELSREILKNPVSVEVTPASTTAQTVSQQVYFTNKDSKKDLLLSLLENEQMDQVLIFTRTKHGADRLTKELARKKIKAAAIHGNKSQNNRQRSLNDFKDKSLRVLVATDIAARGIDIEKLNWVVNYEIPNEPETYVHRIGRVGRAGETGTSISISEPEENDYIKGIEKLIKKSIPIAEHPDFPQTDKPMTAAEKKAFDKEKNQRKMEAIKARREKARSDRGGQDSRGRSRSGKRR
jgi:ATP-dependent RNA helicase RhlE